MFFAVFFQSKAFLRREISIVNMAPVSRRGKVSAAAKYLEFRARHLKNSLVSRYNHFLERSLGSTANSNFSERQLFQRKVMLAKAGNKEKKRKLLRLKKDVDNKRVVIGGTPSEIRKAHQNLSDRIAVCSAVDLALSSKEARERVKKLQKRKKGKSV